MKRYLFIILVFLTNLCCAQKYLFPVFDRTDTPAFHLDSVIVSETRTSLYVTYKAEDHSWACISDSTYLEDIYSGKRFKISGIEGLPLSPEKRHFIDSTTIKVVLFFPHTQSTKFNMIEDEDDVAFNIYGINLSRRFYTLYTAKDIHTFFDLAKKEEERENWLSAINYSYKQLEAAKYIEGVRSLPTACAMYNLLLNYFQVSNYEKMIEWGLKSIEILRMLPQDSLTLDVLSRAYGSLSSAYLVTKQTEKSNYYEEMSLALRRDGHGIGNVSYGDYLNHMANGYYYNQIYPKALLYKKEYVDLIESKHKEDSLKWGCAFILALGELSEFYQQMNKYEEAYRVSNKALELIDNGECEEGKLIQDIVRYNMAALLAKMGEVGEAIKIIENILYHTSSEHISIHSRMNLAELYLECEQDTIKAISEYESTLKIIEEVRASKEKDYGYNPEYSTLLQLLYLAYRDRDLNKALWYLKKAIQHQKEWQGDESVAYGNMCLKYLNNLYFISNSLSGTTEEKDNLRLLLRQVSEIFKRHIINSSYNMSRSERLAYWQRYAYIYNWLIPTVCGMIGDTKLAYDAVLFYKGNLLSSEKDFKDVIRLSSDDSLISLYQEYVDNLSLLEKQYNSQPSAFIIDSLQHVIKDQEFLLSQKVTRFNRERKGTNFSWEEIKEKLSGEDIAIELTSYYSLKGEYIYYDAYIIDNKSASPLLLYMFDEKQLDDCLHKDSINYEGLSELIWGNKYLKKVLENKKNIYISVSGLLNAIGIEYLPIGRGKYINERYNIYRVSSTREICYARNTCKMKRACLYGGLDYNFATHDFRNNDNVQTNRISRAVADSIVIRGGFDPLYGSRQEIDQIRHEMEQKDIYCNVFVESEGSEDSFKKQSGKNVNIIHLSTHGMYVFDRTDSLRYKKDFRFVLSDIMPEVDEETSALSRSFLVMSGGNKLIQQDSIPNNEEDGILTALEISHLDFHDLDLVVLSACETALGKIDSEGVYGMQRAFKKAGANTILMSLDKVDDEATRILMVEFYKNLMSGKTKLESLRNAQKYLRQVENGKYADPKYWASFILLDGLN